jgi:hypothetical protein
MYDNLSGPVHSHGTVIVRVDGVDYWVDTSMLTDRVFPLVPGEETLLDGPLHPVRVEPVDQLWRVWWPHPFLDEMIGCLLLDDDVTADHYLARYEFSRGIEPLQHGCARDPQCRRRARDDRVRAALRARTRGRPAAGAGTASKLKARATTRSRRGGGR